LLLTAAMKRERMAFDEFGVRFVREPDRTSLFLIILAVSSSCVAGFLARRLKLTIP
jgi:hypothetical protein